MNKETQMVIRDFMENDDPFFTKDMAQVKIGELARTLNLPASVRDDFTAYMMDLWDVTKVVAGKIINVGRILLIKIFEFIKENPSMVAGYIVGLILGVFISQIPFVGSVLSLLSPFFPLIGTIIGAYADAQNKKTFGVPNSNTFVILIEGASEAFKRFLELSQLLLSAVIEGLR